MAQYRVKQYFQWGPLSLEKEQILEANEVEYGWRVSVLGGEDSIIVTRQALNWMVESDRITLE
jgi:hypothetical protein